IGNAGKPLSLPPVPAATSDLWVFALTQTSRRTKGSRASVAVDSTPAPSLEHSYRGDPDHVVHDRIRPHREPGLPALGGNGEAGETPRHGGVPEDDRGSRARLRRVLGAIRARRAAVAQ